MRAYTFLVVFLGALSSCSTSRGLDASVEDAPLARRDLDPIGRWEACRRTWIFGADGSAQRIEHALGCSARGAWSVSGSTLTVTWESDACESAEPFVAEGLRTTDGLLLSVAGVRTDQLAPEGALIERYRFEDDAGHRTIARRVGGPFGGACYWSEDGACGGLFSCSGRILEWRAGDASIIASTSCTGDCPCGAVLHLTPNASGYDVTYDGVNCDGPYTGTARATPIMD